MKPLLLRVSEAAIALGVGRSMLYEILASGRIDSVKIGNRRLVLADSVEAFVGSLVEGK